MTAHGAHFSHHWSHNLVGKFHGYLVHQSRAQQQARKQLRQCLLSGCAAPSGRYPSRLRAAVKNLFCTTGPKTSLNKRACYDLITTASSTAPVMELLAQWSHDCTKRAPACGRPRHPFQPPRRWISVPGRQQQRHLKTALEFLGSTDRHSQRHRYLVRDHPSDRLPPRQQHSWAAARDVPYASRITGRTEDLPVMVDLVAALAGERLGAAGKGCEELSGMLSVVLCKDGEEDVFVVLIHRILHERGRHISSLHVAGAVRRAISRR